MTTSIRGSVTMSATSDCILRTLFGEAGCPGCSWAWQMEAIALRWLDQHGNERKQLLCTCRISVGNGLATENGFVTQSRTFGMAILGSSVRCLIPNACARQSEMTDNPVGDSIAQWPREWTTIQPHKQLPISCVRWCEQGRRAVEWISCRT